MTQFVVEFNYWLAVATVVAQFVTVALVIVYLLRNRVGMFREIADTIAKWGLWLGFIQASGATLIMVFYSDYLGFEPCYWCYWQRIFMFPQIVLLGMAAWKRDAYMADYSIVLSVLGAGVALYHHLLQMFPGSLPCPSTGVSCATRVIFEFGYVTIPLMAVTAFAFMIVVMMFVRTKREVA